MFKSIGSEMVSVSDNSKNTNNNKLNTNGIYTDKINTVDTSDSSNIFLYAGICIASLIAILAIIIYKKKHI